jgi:hypothetical protein
MQKERKTWDKMKRNCGKIGIDGEAWLTADP